MLIYQKSMFHRNYLINRFFRRDIIYIILMRLVQAVFFFRKRLKVQNLTSENEFLARIFDCWEAGKMDLNLSPHDL